MLEPKRISMNVQLDKIQFLGNGTYYYNYDIQSEQVLVDNIETDEPHEETRWNYIQVHLKGFPDYKKCIEAVIRAYLTLSEELAIINKYNSYQLGVIKDPSASSDYYEYTSLIATIKTNVKKDFEILEPEVSEELVPSQADMIKLLQILITTAELSDTQALMCKSLYPTWRSCIGKTLNAGDKITYKGILYKVKQTINTVLENQAPGIETAALYEEIDEKHKGTKEDPIPYNGNMELKLGKYYSQEGVIYLCSRDSGQVVYNSLKDLVGIYVVVA